MRGTKKRNSTKVVEKKVKSDVKNCFMFDEEESPKNGNNTINSSSSSQWCKATEFCTDKPYRLALYVHPSTRRKVDPSDSKILANLTLLRQNRDKENIDKAKKTRAKASKENVNVTLFDEENDTSKCEKKIRKLDDKTPADGEKPSKLPKKGILSYVNINESVPKKIENDEIESFIPKSKQKRVRRAYVKKAKENTDSEVVDEPPSEELEQEKETKKSTKSKVKKEDAKEEDEFQKWAESINSDFDEVDKFELSITYD